MRYRFIGQYTHGRTSIVMNGVHFEGHEPSEVPEEVEFRFAGNVEFEASEEVSEPKKRGRPRKDDQ